MAIFEITMLFIGAIIGAGFATGAEIVTFFGTLQLPAWLIAILVTITISCIIMFIIIQDTRIATPLLDIFFIILYMIIFTAMTAGITQITGPLFTIATLCFAGIITHSGINNLKQINAIIVILIIIMLFFITIPYQTTLQDSFQITAIPQGFFWAFIYAGLNCLTFFDLIPSIRKQNSLRTVIYASLITAIIIGILVYLILTAINTTNTQAASMPLLAIVNKPYTFIIILMAIITSQYTTLFAVIQKLKKILPNKKTTNSDSLIIPICLITFAGSFIGFSKILKYGYIFIGIFICVYLMFSLLVVFLSRHSHHD